VLALPWPWAPLAHVSLAARAVQLRELPGGVQETHAWRLYAPVPLLLMIPKPQVMRGQWVKRGRETRAFSREWASAQQQGLVSLAVSHFHAAPSSNLKGGETGQGCPWV